MTYKTIGMLLEDVMCEMCSDELEKVENRIKKHDTHRFSDSFIGRMNILLGKGNFSRSTDVIDPQPLPTETRKGRVPFRYMLIAILLFIMLSGTVMAYEPIREQIGDFIVTLFPDRVSIVGDEEILATDKITGVWRLPSYIPEDYQLEVADFDDDLKESFIMWSKGTSESSILFLQSSSNSGVTLSSDGSVPEEVIVGGHKAKYIVDERNLATVYYEEDGFLIFVNGVLEKEELIRIAESIQSFEEIPEEWRQ